MYILISNLFVKGMVMKCAKILLISLLLCFGSPADRAQADMDNIDLGVSIGDGELQGFYLSMGDYFHVPQQEIIIIQQRGIPYYEIPVVYHIVQCAHVSPSLIVNLRLGGSSWIDICLHYGCSPEIFYVPVAVEVSGPPYGHAYGHYKKRPKEQWREIRLSDDDIINLVNLKVISEHHHCAPEEVIKIRSAGSDFAAVNDHIQKNVRAQKTKDNGSVTTGVTTSSSSSNGNVSKQEGGGGKKNSQVSHSNSQSGGNGVGKNKEKGKGTGKGKEK